MLLRLSPTASQLNDLFCTKHFKTRQSPYDLPLMCMIQAQQGLHQPDPTPTGLGQPAQMGTGPLKEDIQWQNGRRVATWA